MQQNQKKQPPVPQVMISAVCYTCCDAGDAGNSDFRGTVLILIIKK